MCEYFISDAWNFLISVPDMFTIVITGFAEIFHAGPSIPTHFTLV